LIWSEQKSGGGASGGGGDGDGGGGDGDGGAKLKYTTSDGLSATGHFSGPNKIY
jgi:hypothetical protein